MAFSFSTFVLIILVLWCAIVTYFLFRMISHYNRLIGETPKGTLKDVLEVILDKQSSFSDRTDEIEKNIRALEKETTMHIQRVGFVRFNPFADTGGSHSFTLAFMDSLNNGIVMTSLYTRTGGRWYIKHVKDGKGVGYELSKEEQSAVSKATYIVDSKG